MLSDTVLSMLDDCAATAGKAGRVFVCTYHLSELLRVYRLVKDAPPCVWTYDDTDNTWDAPCGSKWCFIEGDPEDNGVKFCQKCGKPVRLVADTPAKEGR